MLSERYVFKFNSGKYFSMNPKDNWVTFTNIQVHFCENLLDAELFTENTIHPYLYDMIKAGWGNILKVIINIQTIECD